MDTDEDVVKGTNSQPMLSMTSALLPEGDVVRDKECTLRAGVGIQGMGSKYLLCSIVGLLGGQVWIRYMYSLIRMLDRLDSILRSR